MDISRFLDFKNRWQLTKDAILWLICGLLLLNAGNLLESNFSLKFPYIIDSLEPIKIAEFFLFLILLFMLFKDLFLWIKVHWWVLWNRNSTYVFNDKDWPDKWISNGRTELSDEGYLFVKSSRAGCLLKDNYWRNFKTSFEMKFSRDKFGNQKRFGLIFRAEDFDNYFMIEIGENEETYEREIEVEENGKKKIEKEKVPVSSIKPHVRYKGGWEVMSVTEIKESFDFSGFAKVSLEVKGNTARFFYKETPVFKWVLPTYVDINHIESGVEDNREKTKEIVVGGAFAGHVQKIPFRLGYGLVGFRAHWHHTGTHIRNLRIEPL